MLVVWETVFVGAVREPPAQVEQTVLLVVGANAADRHSSLAPGTLSVVHGHRHHFPSHFHLRLLLQTLKGENGGCSTGLDLWTFLPAYTSIHYFMSMCPHGDEL